jgi:hypothetical protein
MKRHWQEPHYWGWFWRYRVPFPAQVAAVVLLLIGLLGGGWAVADRLTSAQAGVSSGRPFVLETTIEKLVTVRAKGRAQLRTRTVRTLVPAAAKVRVVTVVDKPRTVVTTRLEPTTRTETAVRTRTVTKTLKVARPAPTVTMVKTSTVTKTETQTQTLTQTETVTHTETRAVTVPGEAVTKTVTNNVTVTVTVAPSHPK